MHVIRSCTNFGRRVIARLTVLVIGLLSIPTSGSSQAPGPPVVDGELAAPVEVAMSVVNDEVRCGPPRARLPSRDPVDLRVVNRSDRALWFAAPQFFAATKHVESAGFVLDLVDGGFLVAPQSTARVVLHTPAPGEYYFSCFLPGRVPNPQSSGFLIVVPAAN